MLLCSDVSGVVIVVVFQVFAVLFCLLSDLLLWFLLRLAFCDAGLHLLVPAVLCVSVSSSTLLVLSL